MKEKVALIKEILASLRELILILVFIMVLFAPKLVNTILNSAGFVQGNIMGFEWKSKVDSLNKNSRDMGTLVSQISDQRIPNISSAIESLEKKIKDPALKDTLMTIKMQLSDIQVATKQADDIIQQSIIQQEHFTPEKEIFTVQNGWFYGGHVKDNKKEWMKGAAKNIESNEPPTAKGASVKLNSDTYLRKDTDGGFYTKSPVISVLEKDAEFEVQEIGYTKALKGGYFIWIKVQKQNN
ncbi:MAG: hypothetical protein IT236_06195 [Bacteroidia bacterium]|nr:hypothetical protein [Bacteroidia bacterium]